MQKLLLLTILFSLISMSTSAQIWEEEKSMNLGVINALVLELPNTTEKIVEKEWKKYTKQFKAKTKKVKKTDEWLTDDAKILAIGGANTLDLYARIEPSGEFVNLVAWFDLGGAFLSSDLHPDRFNEAEKLLMRFALEVAKEMTHIELEAEEKELKQLEKTFSNLVRDSVRYVKEITNCEEKIRKAKINLAENGQDQKSATKQIDLQKGVIEEVQKRLNDLN